MCSIHGRNLFSLGMGHPPPPPIIKKFALSAHRTEQNSLLKVSLAKTYIGNGAVDLYVSPNPRCHATYFVPDCPTHPRAIENRSTSLRQKFWWSA